MDDAKQKFLNLKHLPGVVNRQEAAWLLGFDPPEEVSIVTNAGHLRPLGRPAKSGRKRYCTHKLQQLNQDEKWLDRSMEIIKEYWKRKNAGRRSSGEE